MRYLSESELVARREAARRRRRRRTWLGGAALAIAVAVTVGLALVLTHHAGHAMGSTPGGARGALFAGRHVARSSSGKLPAIAPARPGVARVILHGPARREIALTVDDGFCAPCVARIVRTLARTHAHATIFPNGRYATSWDPQASTIRRLIARGQLTVGNHTFLHIDPRLESPVAFETDLIRDESWIEKQFAVSARPFFRPPYGAYDPNTLATAGRLGFTKVIIWSGTVADSSPRSIPYILGAIRHWGKPGAIILMHGNYPATSLALPKILALLRAMRLKPVTLAELLG